MNRKSLRARTRVRLEFSAFPSVSGVQLLPDKKLTALRVLLSERFKEKGLGLFKEWCVACALEQQNQDESPEYGGPPDAA